MVLRTPLYNCVLGHNYVVTALVHTHRARKALTAKLYTRNACCVDALSRTALSSPHTISRGSMECLAALSNAGAESNTEADTRYTRPPLVVLCPRLAVELQSHSQSALRGVRTV